MPSQEWKVLLPKSIDESGPNSIEDIATFTSIKELGVESANLSPHIATFDAVILRHGQLTQEVIEQADNLKVIAKHGVGLDNVDIQSATEQGIVVCNTPNANSHAVAEHALTLLLATTRRLPAMDSATRNGQWDQSQWNINELRGQTLGLYGCGDIAHQLVEVSRDIGMNYIGYDPYIDDDDLSNDITKVDKQTLFSEADAVSIHVPHTEETHHAISTSELALLSSDAIIINTARGPVVDEKALISALDNDELAGAGLDVFTEEPPSTSNPLFDMECTVVTPHIAASTAESLKRMAQRAAANVRSVYNGELPDSTVNPEVFESKSSIL